MGNQETSRSDNGVAWVPLPAKKPPSAGQNVNNGDRPKPTVDGEGKISQNVKITDLREDVLGTEKARRL